LGLNSETSSGLGAAWESVQEFFSQTFESTSGTRKEKSSNRGLAGLFFGNTTFSMCMYNYVIVIKTLLDKYSNEWKDCQYFLGKSRCWIILIAN